MTRTPERDAEIVRMWLDNMKAVEIAAVLGVTKNTIIGAVDRAKKRGELPLYRENTNVSERQRKKHEAEVISLRAVKAEREAEEAARSARVRQIKAEVERRQAEHNAKLRAEADKIMKEAEPKPPTSLWPSLDPDPPSLGGVSLWNVRQGQCRYPLDRLYQGLAIFCGKPTTTVLGSWCDHHRSKCFSRVPLKPRGDKPFLQLAGKGRERAR